TTLFRSERGDRELEDAELAQCRKRFARGAKEAMLRDDDASEQRFRPPAAIRCVARAELVALERRIRRGLVALIRGQVGIEAHARAGADHVVLIRESEQR